MTERISAKFAKLLALSLVAVAALAISAAAASAANEVVYNNLNTVASSVNGHPNQDTFSLSAENFPVGGLVEFPHTRDNILKTLTAQVDNFTCEHGSYSLENCYTIRSKKMQYEMNAKIYAVGANNEPVGEPIAESVETMKLPYRPTTNVSCPATSEGKGFGVNCDVGGVLATVKFKHFEPKNALLPVKAAIMVQGTIRDTPNLIVNIGLQSSYKEFTGGEFIAEGPADGGVPAVGSDPLPESIYTQHNLNEGGWEGFQPVFEVVAKP